MFKSKGGSTVTLDDDKGTIELKDGGGKGKVTISKDDKVELEALQGDNCYQAKEDMIILANDIKISAGSELQFVSGGGGTKACGDNVTINGSSVKIAGSQVDFHPGGVPKAEAASGTVATVPDPIK